LRHLQWHWHLAGDCDRSPETVRRLRERAALAGLTDRITFHGVLRQEAVAALMAESDLMVSPSTFEAYGMAVAEAAAAGLPVLSNRVGAAEQLIEHGATGFLATAGDWDAFGGYLRVLLQDAALRVAFQDNLRRAAVRGWDKTLANFRAPCEAMLQCANRKGVRCLKGARQGTGASGRIFVARRTVVLDDIGREAAGDNKLPGGAHDPR